MERHTDEPTAAAASGSRSGLTIISIVAILALVMVGFAVRGLFGAESRSAETGSGDTQSSVSADQASSTDDSSSTAARPDMGGSDSAEVTAEAPETEDAVASSDDAETDADVPQALQACGTEVSVGEEWAAATQASASHWKKHYSASVQYKAGEITLEQAEADFAESKAEGAADVEAVTAAAKNYEAVKGACSESKARVRN